VALAPEVLSSRCASRRYIRLIGSKWTLLVIHALKLGRLRNGDLMRRIDGVSQKMLTQTLRQLEEMNLVLRIDQHTVPPHVEYELTKLGEALAVEVGALIRWVEGHVPELGR
jgi:DNA-binding HxlR family transcriptional regulator